MTASGLRVLVTAGSSRFAALVVSALERRQDVATVIAVDDRAPGAPFARAEFVRLGADLVQLPRIVRGADVDVVVDVRAAAAIAPLSERTITGHAAVSTRVATACTEGGSPVRRLVTVGSVHRYGWDRDLPAFLTEDVVPPAEPRSALGRALAEIEGSAVAAQARRPDLRLTTIRLADHVGPAGCGILQAADRLPLLPTVLGFDPPVQVVHEEDAAAAVAHAVGEQLDGQYLVAADGTLALSEALRILGRAHAPVLPPWGTGVIAGVLARAGLGGAHELAG
jgi:UDP-glucose 4-epimerase